MATAKPGFDLPDTSLVIGAKRMATEIECVECPEVFTGPGMWNEYAGHLGAEHPQAEPTPAQRDVTGPPREVVEVEVEPGIVVDVVEDVGREAVGKSAESGTAVSQTVNPSEPPGSAEVEAPSGTEAEEGLSERPDPVASTTEPLAAVLYEQRRVLAAALDEYGWHRSECPAYLWTQEGDLASEADDPKHECSCGFRELLALTGGAS